MSNDRSDRVAIVPATAEWQALIAVCKKCDHADRDLPSRIKHRLKERGRRDVRVVASTCLDVCPKHGTTCAYTGEGGPRRFVVRSGADDDAILARLLDEPGRTPEPEDGPA